MLLVTQYHPRGSLFDYLNNPDTSLTAEIALKLIKTSLNGLKHLHSVIHTSYGKKSAIAHRDIKSKNILIRGNHFNDLDISCVLADFGLAVRETEIEMKELDLVSVKMGFI